MGIPQSNPADMKKPGTRPGTELTLQFLLPGTHGRVNNHFSENAI